MEVEIYFDDRSEVYVLPHKYIVCPNCEGEGSTVNPSIDGSGISADEFLEDPSFYEDYMSGVYDITCRVCKGKRVIKAIDSDNLNDKEKEIFSLYQKQEEEERRYRKECEDEFRMQELMSGCY